MNEIIRPKTIINEKKSTDDLQSILINHHSKSKVKSEDTSDPEVRNNVATTSEIPDLFFDEILTNFKLNRFEILVLMYLYRLVWCRPNLYKTYGYGQVLSLTEVAKSLNIETDEVYNALRKLESLDFIETIRAGQYFVRKYFTAELDKFYGQNYDDF
ncbi:MAG: hypothetical protein U0T83_05625 [Bacteriovoracaceae bacterium]